MCAELKPKETCTCYIEGFVLEAEWGGFNGNNGCSLVGATWCGPH